MMKKRVKGGLSVQFLFTYSFVLHSHKVLLK